MTPTYLARRRQLTEYFDRTAAKAWEALTSSEPVGRIRATVRAGRDEMRAVLLGWLPEDLAGRQVLDAGCGTGSFAVEAAGRGAAVTAVDVSPTLVDVARRRTPADLAPRIDYAVGDMLDPQRGPFDHVVAMDSLIHYTAPDMVRAIEALAGLARESVVLTFAPRTPALAAMHAVGRLFPHLKHRAPAIEPVSEKALRRRIGESAALAGWHIEHTHRVTAGFYISQALELRRS